MTNQYASGGSASFTMDAFANAPLKGPVYSTPLRWNEDAGNRVTTMAKGSTVTIRRFDANANLTLEPVIGNATSYLYDSENRLSRRSIMGKTDFREW